MVIDRGCGGWRRWGDGRGWNLECFAAVCYTNGANKQRVEMQDRKLGARLTTRVMIILVWVLAVG